ncbi:MULTISPECIES: NAD(P)/FAD-dependent oxidoreductase [Prochlorococcus]|uniref:NADH dehydrogenase, FAD-containing subunit n=1 Tax=Prochlorococcus marinus (strain SARG / CCMP1375 / SS120) TaxID=167539 RepID=Q7VEB7_PROMA|nr:MULTISPECIES: FAD-dependent oxidoreductase [Prochlorococcus]AAP99142.1 NADH dehydrogenase, FAD-containing subunit [Prochlorococcus marinus subsp. marinus str. CCMP1375]KGG11590.1 NADH dehydrogenase [Prochlorococcus marinus str. LG]KGG18456.1 NADH dehydrogenase [Prochlorococcus marinus str. SS2]KGG22729.1 NADH dehydrogenase [Prochlorococcus marinus str. SS35]KGG32605.1 NADH dehydrogenase [Prochlorococcus marinus str. SS51]
MKSNFSKNGAVVVVGGGFGGLTAALSLSRCKQRPPIILIEPSSRFNFLPLFYELLSGELEVWEVAPFYKTLLASKGIVLIDQFVDNIDLDKEVVSTSAGQVIKYGQLVIATGSKLNSFGISGVNEHCLKFNKYQDVLTLKRVIRRLNHSNENRQNLVIVGAGATGVELACKVADLVDARTEIHLIEVGENILPKGRSFNQEQIQEAIRKRSINLHLNTNVLKVLENNVEIQSLSKQHSQPFSLNHSGIIWTAGVKSAIPSGLPETLIRNGRVAIDSKLQIIGRNNVFSIGDMAIDQENPCLGTAQVAMQQGEHLAKNVIAARQGKDLTPFEFVDRGEMLSMGIGEATITGMGLTISGSIAFKMRRMAYLSKFPNLFLSIRSAGSWLLSDGKKFI